MMNGDAKENESVTDSKAHTQTIADSTHQTIYDQHVQAYYEQLSQFCSHNLVHEMKKEPPCEHERSLLDLVFHHGDTALGLAAEHPDDVNVNQEFTALFHQIKSEHSPTQVGDGNKENNSPVKRVRTRAPCL